MNPIKSIVVFLFSLVLTGCLIGDDIAARDHDFELKMSFTPTKAIEFSWSKPNVSSAKFEILEQIKHGDGFKVIATLGMDDKPSYTHVVPLYSRLNAIYYIRSTVLFTVKLKSENLYVAEEINSAIGYVKASNTGKNDFFGESLSLSSDGKTLAVGASFEDSNAKSINGVQTNDALQDSGAVYVFTLSGTKWTQQAYLKASNAGAGDEFGASVSLSSDGNTLSVGASAEDSSAVGINGDQNNDSQLDSGAVYVFTRTDNNWSQQAYLKAGNTSADDRFGLSASLSKDGNTLAVGADGDDDMGSTVDAGAVYVFTRSAGAWAQQAYLQASNVGADDFFGEHLALSLDGDTLAVSAQEDSNATGINGAQNNESSIDSGAVYVFTRNTAGNWSQHSYIKASNAQTLDYFGNALSLSSNGETLAVGAKVEDSNANRINGAQNNDSSKDSGAVYVFTLSGNLWAQEAYLKAKNAGVGDEFGTSVSLSSDGNTLTVGAPLEDGSGQGLASRVPTVDSEPLSDSGAGYVFTRSGLSWSHQTYLKASNTGADDRFGSSLVLSPDGNTLAVSAPFEGSNSKGVNKSSANNEALKSGAVFLY